MSDAKTNTPTNEDPSIEEILGSIRRIIADDDDQPAPSPAPSPAAFSAPTGGDVGSLDEDDEPPLELTQKVDEDGTVIDLQAYAGDDNDAAADDAAFPPQTSFTPPVSHSPAVEDTDSMVDFADESQTGAETLVSHVAANATAAVMAKLARNTSVSRSGGDGVTIEDMVKDMLRPMLREWLDDNLPEMVQSMVERELERISRRVG